MITALPIRGEPVVSPRVSPSWALDIAARLGMEMPESQRSSNPRGIPLVWLRDNFLNFSSFANEETRKRHLFAYLLWLLGNLFPNSHGDVVVPGLIYIAENMVDEPLPEQPKYSFGSAMLSHTYRGLCDATQKASFAQKAPLLCVAYEFLQLWSWEYLPVGRPRIVQPIYPYNFSEGACATMATRWTKARKRWSPDIAKNCYPMYHQQFEILNEAEVTWNPWTQDQLKMVFDARHFTPGMLTDSAFWLTRCNLLFLWCVEPYNPERVMRQFGLYQEIPPLFPRRIDEETHKLPNMGRGWSLYDWREENIEWVHKWENEALADIVHQLRPYGGSTDQAYKQWYCMNTRASLASQPANIPTHLTQEEQARRHVELHAAYYRDQMLENVNEVGQMATDSMPAQGPYRKTFQKLLQQFVAKKFRCGRGDDVVTGAYMPVARSARPSAAQSSRPSAAQSSRPSEARTSHEQWGKGPSTRTTLPRHDSSLPLHRSSSMQLRQGQTSQGHGTGLDSMPEQFLSPNPYAYTGYDAYTQGEGSQPYLSTRGIPMPEETRVPDLN
ncbi:protein MAIN-LIKE 1-like [Triticum dicoccoides]|uniref:protein MAIN-LIKE 1-like n=1 Tax=Triticum dicoccoides TaxID=85692 RepID=UPI00188DDEE6|nr:protein MAIN-LIKE 1-like [Triticum dicoccoides]